jgi:hypothetical protein
MIIKDPYLDINGLVLPSPRTEDKPSDNGILFTSIAVVLEFEVPDYVQKVRECFLEPGLMARWKGNNFDNIAWDDYLAVAVASIYIKEKGLARDILWYGLKHFFVYNTNGKLEAKDFLLRNIPIWPLIAVSAYPILKYPMYPLMWLVQKFFKDPYKLIQDNDTSGFQLQWLFLYGCSMLGFMFESFIPHVLARPEAFKIYYSPDHPFQNA